MKNKPTSDFLINILIGGIVIFFIIIIGFTVFPKWFVSNKTNRITKTETDSVTVFAKTTDGKQGLKPIDELISDSIPYSEHQRLEDSIHTLRKLRNGEAMALASSASLNPIATFVGGYCTTCGIRYEPNSKPHFLTLNKPVQNYILLLDWKIKQPKGKWYGDSSQYYVDDKGQSYLRKTITNKSSYPDDIAVPFRYNAKYNCLMIPVQLSTKQNVQILLIITALLLSLYILFFIIGGFVKFLLDISRGETFTLMNVRRLKIIAFSLIVYPVLILIVDLSMPLIFHSYFTSDVTLSISNWSALCIFLFIGLVFLLLYKAFRTGKRIKEEQDLTV